MENKVVPMAFAAIDKVIVNSIPKLTQNEYRNRDYIYYGDDNRYCDYLYGLYTDCSTLKTTVNGVSSYVAANDVICNVPGFTVANKKGDTFRNIIKWLDRDFNIYGGCAFQVIRNIKGEVAEIYYIDFRYLRSDKKNECFWYSEEFSKPYGRTTKAVVYPKFVPGGDAPASIVYLKNDIGGTYPTPSYSGAIKAAEIERHIDDMHLNSLENGFMGSYIINFLNGIPTDEQKDEIEKNVTEKFAGTANAGRILLNFANGEENAAKVERLDITDFADKYKAAAERARTTIYQAFRAQGQLFGDMSASTGFNEIEFKTAWDLFNSTVVRDQQRVLCDEFDHVFGMKGSITIDPFVMGDTSNVN